MRPGDRGLEIARALHDLEHLRVLDHARQAVAAEQEDVAVLDVVLDVDLNRVAHAERARDDVLVREVALLVLGHVGLGFLVVLEQRVVARHLLDRIAADAIAARVADVREVELVADDLAADDRRAHALESCPYVAASKIFQLASLMPMTSRFST